METKIEILVANESHLLYVEEIFHTIETSAKIRGTGIAKRKPEYIEQKMREGKAIIALQGEIFAGFSYIETWENKQFVATSGLIVAEAFRGQGIAWEIKQQTFCLARERYPNAKIFSITTGSAVMRMNEKLGYLSVALVELTKDEAFWRGCQECKNHDILERSEGKFCCCSAMMFNPKDPLCIAKLGALNQG
jgi:GNAT superfamily N-acetyltransferase